jgi:ribonucleoside-diphosphate reductase alpha chain
MGEEKLILKVKKRNGTVIPFMKSKITEAIFRAAKAVGGSDRKRSEEITDIVVEELLKLKKENPTVEEIQDTVEKVLIKEGHAKTAKHYILYRAQHQKDREQRASILGYAEDTKMDIAGALVAKKRYLIKKVPNKEASEFVDVEEIGERTETIKEMFERVADEIIKGEALHTKKKEQLEEYRKKFIKMMKEIYFLPGGRILANSGRKDRFLMNSFVLPMEDKIEGIFETLKRATIIQKGGGGTGFDFSKLRPIGSETEQTESSAAGPLSFIVMFNDASKTIRNRGNRMGANMGVLRIDHPQILDFITLKDKINLEHFNISIGITDQFMEAVSKNQDYPIIDPFSKKEVNRVKARRILDLATTMAWKTADPGILFIDRINRDNPTPELGQINSTDTCGEMPMYPNESCPLGSINLSRFIKKEDEKGNDKKIDFDKLKEIVHLAVRFLDDAIDASWYPFKEIEEETKNFRRIGLGVMGWADLLYALKIPYNSTKALNLAREVMGFINKEADSASQTLAKERGEFLKYKGSTFEKEGKKRRNATVTAIAPTGSISLLAGTSSSIEPNFALSTMRQLFSTQKVLIVNKEFEKTSFEEGFHSENLLKEVAEYGSLKYSDVPENIKRIFVVAHDIEPRWHIRMQAAFQENTEGAISKTINFPNEASVQEIYDAFTESYKMGVKGISIYRDGSKENQVLQRAY